MRGPRPREKDYLKDSHCSDPNGTSWPTALGEAWRGIAVLLDPLCVIGSSNNDAATGGACPGGLPQLHIWAAVGRPLPIPAGPGEPGIAVLDDRIHALGAGRLT